MVTINIDLDNFIDDIDTDELVEELRRRSVENVCVTYSPRWDPKETLRDLWRAYKQQDIHEFSYAMEKVAEAFNLTGDDIGYRNIRD